MVKVAINTCYGGFGLSDEACEWLINEKGWTVGNIHDPKGEQILRNRDASFGKYYIPGAYGLELRTNPDVIECIETLGDKVNTELSEIKIVQIPADVDFYIDEYDGIEHVAETHRTWY